MRTIGLSQCLQWLENFLSVYFSILLTKLYKKKKTLNGPQFGFQKHKSSIDAVLHLIEALQENYDKLSVSVAVFIDLAKAFNL